jgi:hypothetical protein
MERVQNHLRTIGRESADKELAWILYCRRGLEQAWWTIVRRHPSRKSQAFRYSRSLLRIGVVVVAILLFGKVHCSRMRRDGRWRVHWRRCGKEAYVHFYERP